MVHSLDHQRIASCPVIAVASDKPDAHRVAPGHEPEAVVLDLVNPVRPSRRLWGGGKQAGLKEVRPVRGQESNRTPPSVSGPGKGSPATVDGGGAGDPRRSVVG